MENKVALNDFFYSTVESPLLTRKFMYALNSVCIVRIDQSRLYNHSYRTCLLRSYG